MFLRGSLLKCVKKTGKNYPAETLYEIVICLQLWMHMKGRSVKLLDDSEFVEIRNCLDN